MRTPKRHHKRTIDDVDGCRNGRRPSPEARARHADAIAQASLRRMFPRF
jgi:hypothetical protein